MESKLDIIRRERAALRQRYGDLFDTVAAILFEADPMEIYYGTNTDEYEPEAGTILPRLSQAGAAEDVTRIVHEEFVRWFSADDAGPREQYHAIATSIWEAWHAFNQRPA